MHSTLIWNHLHPAQKKPPETYPRSLLIAGVAFGDLQRDEQAQEVGAGEQE